MDSRTAVSYTHLCSDDDDNGGGDLAMALQSSVVGTYEGDLRVVLPALQLDNTQKRKIFVKADGQMCIRDRDYSYEALAEGYFGVRTDSSEIQMRLQRMEELIRSDRLSISDRCV